MNEFVLCKACGWVHFNVSKQYVLDWENHWKVIWNGMSDSDKADFGCEKSPPKVKDVYINCSRCGGSYKNFRDAKKEELPLGSTIVGILNRQEDI
jgi:ribosomal protein L37E